VGYGQFGMVSRAAVRRNVWPLLAYIRDAQQACAGFKNVQALAIFQVLQSLLE